MDTNEQAQPKESLEDQIKALKRSFDILWSEVFMASTTEMKTGETRMHLKGKVDRIEEKLRNLAE